MSGLPADNIWNAPVDKLPVDRNPDALVKSIGADKVIAPRFRRSTLAVGAHIAYTRNSKKSACTLWSASLDDFQARPPDSAGHRARFWSAWPRPRLPNAPHR